MSSVNENPLFKSFAFFGRANEGKSTFLNLLLYSYLEGNIVKEPKNYSQLPSKIQELECFSYKEIQEILNKDDNYSNETVLDQHAYKVNSDDGCQEQYTISTGSFLDSFMSDPKSKAKLAPYNLLPFILPQANGNNPTTEFPVHIRYGETMQMLVVYNDSMTLIKKWREALQVSEHIDRLLFLKELKKLVKRTDILDSDASPSDVKFTASVRNKIEQKFEIFYGDGIDFNVDRDHIATALNRIMEESPRIHPIVSHCSIYLPISFLSKKKIELIDLPGLSDSRKLRNDWISELLNNFDCVSLYSQMGVEHWAHELQFLSKVISDKVKNQSCKLLQLQNCERTAPKTIEEIEEIDPRSEEMNFVEFYTKTFETNNNASFDSRNNPDSKTKAVAMSLIVHPIMLASIRHCQGKLEGNPELSSTEKRRELLKKCGGELVDYFEQQSNEIRLSSSQSTLTEQEKKIEDQLIQRAKYMSRIKGNGEQTSEEPLASTVWAVKCKLSSYPTNIHYILGKVCYEALASLYENHHEEFEQWYQELREPQVFRFDFQKCIRDRNQKLSQFQTSQLPSQARKIVHSFIDEFESRVEEIMSTINDHQKEIQQFTVEKIQKLLKDPFQEFQDSEMFQTKLDRFMYNAEWELQSLLLNLPSNYNITSHSLKNNLSRFCVSTFFKKSDSFSERTYRPKEFRSKFALVQFMNSIFEDAIESFKVHFYKKCREWSKRMFSKNILKKSWKSTSEESILEIFYNNFLRYVENNNSFEEFRAYHRNNGSPADSPSSDSSPQPMKTDLHHSSPVNTDPSNDTEMPISLNSGSTTIDLIDVDNDNDNDNDHVPDNEGAPPKKRRRM